MKISGALHSIQLYLFVSAIQSRKWMGFRSGNTNQNDDKSYDNYAKARYNARNRIDNENSRW